MQFLRKLYASGILVITLNIFIGKAWATPKHVEFWFLKAPSNKAVWLEQLLAPIGQFINLKTAQADDQKCIPVEGGCFHPQYGLIKDVPGDSAEAKPEKTEPIKDIRVKSLSNLEEEELECDKGNNFDVFCGKGKLKGKSKEKYRGSSAKLEVWVDISSSFTSIDYSRDPEGCFRRKFIGALRSKCASGSLKVSIYDTSIKEMGDMTSLCTNSGENDIDRLIRWINASDSKSLIVITDISEYNTKLAEYMSSIGAVMRGLDSKDFVPEDMLSETARLSSLCH